jgi:hypothetical protein
LEIKTGGLKMAEETKFPIAQLRAHCQELFGVSQVVFDGAFFDVDGEIAKKEAKKRIDAWLKKEVK